MPICPVGNAMLNHLQKNAPNILIIMAASQIGDEYEGHMPRSGITAGYRDRSKFA